MRLRISVVLLSVLLISCSKKTEGQGGGVPADSFSTPQPLADASPSPMKKPPADAAPSSRERPGQIRIGGMGSLTAGEHHTCLVAQGEVYCWGYGLAGQLGQGNYQNSAEPLAVRSLGNDNLSVHAGDLHSCAIKQSGQVYCWGFNQTGAVGNGISGREYSFSGQAKLYYVTNPSLVKGLDGVRITDIAATKTTSCGLSSTGEVYCWGSGSSYQLGDGEKDLEQNRYAHHTGIARKVLVLNSPAKEIHGADRAFCAVTVNDKIICWGALTLPTQKAYPVIDLSPGRPPMSLSMADQHHCFVTEDSQLYCIGDNWYQQSGLSTITNVWTRVGMEAFTQVSTARKTTCGITPSRHVRCWGVCLYGLCGSRFAAKLITPTQPQNVFAYTAQKSIEIEGIQGAVEIAVGARHACAMLDTGRVKCWGSGFLGELGHGETQNSADPQEVLF